MAVAYSKKKSIYNSQNVREWLFVVKNGIFLFAGNFTCLEVIFKFRRRLGYYLFHTYIPTCLIVMMSWISFWIKPEAVPARVTLGVTSLLTLSTQHANSQKSLPPVSYIKVSKLVGQLQALSACLHFCLRLYLLNFLLFCNCLHFSYFGI